MNRFTLLIISSIVIQGCQGEPPSTKPGAIIEVEYPTGITQAADLSEVTILSADQNYSCAVATGGVPYCWGDNETGQLGHQDLPNSATPVSLPTPLEPLTHFTAGLNRVCGQTVQGQTYCWGNTDVGSIKHRTLETPYQIQGLPKLRVLDAGGLFDCGIDDRHRVFCWFIHWPVEKDQFENAFYMPNTEAVSVAAGGLHACGLDPHGFVSCWGEWAVTLGPVWQNPPEGVGSPGDIYDLNGVPAMPIHAWQVPLPASTKKIAAGVNHTCALLETGAVYCWGYNLNGVLGLPLTTEYSANPVAVVSSGATDLYAGNLTTCIRRQDGKFSCWGQWLFEDVDLEACSSAFELPDACIRLRPEVTPLPRELSLLAIGNYHLCYYTDRVYCLGKDRYGQLGLGEAASTSTLP